MEIRLSRRLDPLSPDEWQSDADSSCAIIPAMVPPIWLDERGQPRPKQPCPQCGREIPVLTIPPELLRFYGWQPFQVWSTVEWCGHRVEGIPVPGSDGRWRLIPILGEAT